MSAPKDFVSYDCRIIFDITKLPHCVVKYYPGFIRAKIYINNPAKENIYSSFSVLINMINYRYKTYNDKVTVNVPNDILAKYKKEESDEIVKDLTKLTRELEKKCKEVAEAKCSCSGNSSCRCVPGGPCACTKGSCSCCRRGGKTGGKPGGKPVNETVNETVSETIGETVNETVNTKVTSKSKPTKINRTKKIVANVDVSADCLEIKKHMEEHGNHPSFTILTKKNYKKIKNYVQSVLGRTVTEKQLEDILRTIATK